MAENRPPTSDYDSDLPDWLRGHIHSEPGTTRRRPEELPTPPPADSGPPAGMPRFTGMLPWEDEPGAAPGGSPFDQGAPTAESLRGLTGHLPWLDDVAGEQGASGAPSGPPAEDDLLGGLEMDLDATTVSAPTEPGASPFDQGAPPAESLRGLTGQLPWLDDVVGQKPSSGAPPEIPPSTDEEETSWAQQPPPQTGSRSPETLRGLTGQLPWLDDAPTAETPPAAPGAFGGSSIDGDLAALDWMAEVEEEEMPPQPQRPSPADRSAPAADWLSQAPIPSSMPAGDESAAPASPLPDWLAAAEEFGQVEPPAASQAAAPSEGVPDWLTAAEAQDQPGQPAAPSAVVPDWMIGADDFSAGFEEAAAPAEAEPSAAVPEWMVGADDFAAGLEEGAPAEASPAGAGQLDWLASSEADEAFETASSPQMTYEEWMEQQARQEQGPSQEELLAAEVPDWFGQADAEQPEAPAAEAPPPAQAAAGPEFVPDWYLGLEEQDTSAAPDWFSNMDFSADALSAAPVLPQEPEPAPAPPVEQAVEEPTFDFGSLGLEQPSGFEFDFGAVETPAAATAPTPAPADEVPDWFADMAGAGVESGPAETKEEAPDWFAAFEEKAPEPPPQPAGPSPAPEPLAAGEMPDWLSALPQDMPAAPPAQAAPEGEVDFMSLIESGMGADAFAALGEPAAPAGEVLTEKEAQFDLDAMLADLQMPGEEAPGGLTKAGIKVPGGESGAEVPDWLAQARPQEGGRRASAVAIAMRIQETPLEDLTDRLKSLHALTEKAAAEAPPPAQAGTSSILSGVTDSLTPSGVFQEPGAPEMTAALRLEEAQQQRVAVLESLLGLGAAAPEVRLDAEGQPIPASAEEEAKEASRIAQAERRARARSRRKPDRALISILLLLAMILPFFVGAARLGGLPAAGLDPARQGTIDRSIERLRQGDMVLVGFEYTPTAAGEMDPLAEALLTHILFRRARPVIVSTNPAGVLHARNVLANLATDPFLLAQLGRAPNDPLTMPDDYVILPYLPGGVVGLRALTATSTDVNALDRGVFAVDLEGNPTGLDVQFLQISFRLILVLAERGDDLRQWVEQVKAAVGDLPMAAGVAAGAEPVARPYLQSHQLTGLLVGYRDAYSYDMALLNSLPAVTPRPPLEATTTPQSTDGTAAAAAALPASTLDPNITPSPTREGLITLTPTPTVTPTPTETPTSTPTETPEATETPTSTPVSARDATATARAIASGTMPPTALPTQRSFVTATPTPQGGAIGAGPTAQPGIVQADRAYRDERWYSMGLGAVVATAVIGLGALVNILRWIRRRREP